MHGLAKATINFKGLCRCALCGRSKLTEVTNRVETEVVDYSDLDACIASQIKNLFIQPPIGWAVNGRNNFQCDQCMRPSE